MPMARAALFGIILPACCVLMATSGCSLHRTGNGLILRSDWSLEYRHVPWLAFRSGKDAACRSDEGGCEAATPPNSEDGHALAAQKPEGKPEFLPWRSRLKGYRLGSRIFHGKEFTGEQHAYDGTVAAPPANAPPHYLASTPPADSQDDGKPTSSTKLSHLELPDSIGSLPEPNRPDLVVE